MKSPIKHPTKSLLYVSCAGGDPFISNTLNEALDFIKDLHPDCEIEVRGAYNGYIIDVINRGNDFLRDIEIVFKATFVDYL